MFGKSKKLFKKAQQYIPGGLNSAFRSMKSIGNDFGIYMNNGKGSKVYDVDGNEYIDTSMAWGPLVLGHKHPHIEKEVLEYMKNKYWITGTCIEKEIEYAELLCEFFPSAQMVRLQTSGTEAVGLALRIARAASGRDDVVLIRGGYHGHRDDVLAKDIGKGLVSKSDGIPDSVHQHIHFCDYNDIDSLEKLLKESREIGTVFMEPVPCNMNIVLPQNGFLKKVREVCDRAGCILVFDEVIDGLWVSIGGASQRYDVLPDITVLGKAIGGGMPLSAVVGGKKIMSMITPIGNVYAAGTYAGHPVSLAAGCAALNYIKENKDEYTKQEQRVKDFACDINSYARQNNKKVHVTHVGIMAGILFGRNSHLKNQYDVQNLDHEKFSEYYQFMLRNGVYMSPSSEDPLFLSLAHTQRDIDKIRNLTIEFIGSYC